jgi:integrase
MRKRNAKNERIKRRYLIFLEEARQLSTASIDQAATAIAAFEKSTGWRGFERFHIEQARQFKAQLAKAVNEKTGRPLAKATIKSRLKEVKSFFWWLASEPGYRSKLKHSDTEYFNMGANDARIASAKRERDPPTLEDVKRVIASMPFETEIERRDRAILAFILLTGARDDAVASMPLGMVDLDQNRVRQDGRYVRTKNRKTFDTWFFPVGDEITTIMFEWVEHLRGKGFSDADPLFPTTEVKVGGDGHFQAIGLTRNFWSNANAIRTIFKRAFEGVGMKYPHPHLIRKTLVRLGEQICRSPEEFKAWSQNLGHEDVMTTFTSYGTVQMRRQAEIMRELSDGKQAPPPSRPDAKTISWVLTHLQADVAD